MEFGIGSTVTIGTVAVVNPKTIDFPAMEFDKVETTNLSSTGSRTYKPMPLGDPSECTIEALYDSANYAALVAIQGVDAKALSAVCNGTTTKTVASAGGWIKSVKVKANGWGELDTTSIVYQSNTGYTVT
jgi:hypothetical protein